MMGANRMGEAMLPSEPNNTITNRVHKLEPQAKLPTPAVMNTLSAMDQKLLKLLLSGSAEYVENELLNQPAAEYLLRRPLDEAPGAVSESDDSGVYALDSPAALVWNLDREHFLFLRLNYCRLHVLEALREVGQRRLSSELAQHVVHWERAVHDTRSTIVRENMPLVLAMAKRTRISGVDLSDLISEGNLALLRAVNKFDCARGFKFSTYACRAILKSFSRVASRMSRYRGHFPTEFDPALERSDHLERRRDEDRDNSVQELKSILGENLANLSEVEHKVVLARFSLEDDSPVGRAKTLEQVGQMIGVTKERVRQIQNKALGKLRVALEQSALVG